MRKLISILIFFLAFISLNAQGLLTIDSNLIVNIAGQQILAPNGEVIFTIQGNIIFEGDTKKPESIYYTLDNNTILKKSKVNVYDKNGKLGEWYAKNGSIYYKGLTESNKVANVTYDTDYVAFYNAMNDSLLAYVPLPDSIDAAKAFALFQLLWFRFDMKTQYESLQTVSMPAGMENIVGMMEPIFGGGIIWLWDGNFLYPAFDANAYLVWQFDGEKLSPKVAPRTQEEWRWDGDTFKPFWGGNPQNDWRWQGNILRQVWNANYNNEFLFEDGEVRPRFGNFGVNEWKVTGTMPKPLVAAVLLGVLYR